MTRRLRLSVAAILAASALYGGVEAARAGTPTVEDFFRKPQYLGAQLSPSGRYLAVVAPVGEQRGVAVIDLDRKSIVRMKSPGDGDVLRVQWQNDKRLI